LLLWWALFGRCCMRWGDAVQQLLAHPAAGGEPGEAKQQQQ
jgi:hypothetical protein